MLASQVPIPALAIALLNSTLSSVAYSSVASAKGEEELSLDGDEWVAGLSSPFAGE